MGLSICKTKEKGKQKRKPTDKPKKTLLWWGLAPGQGKQRRKKKSSAFDIRQLTEGMYVISTTSLHPAVMPLSMSPIFLE